MTILKALVQFEHDSALAEDRVVNTWHFLTPSGTQETWMDQITAALNNFYNAANAGSTAKLTSLMSASMSGLWSIRFYNIADPEPRVPLRTTNMTAFTPSTAALPHEVALCMSYKAITQSGENVRRRRGRIYLGPWSTPASVITTGGKPSNIANGVMQTIQSAGLALLNASEASADWSWALFSPSDNDAFIVKGGWCDDAWDTMRSRGERRTIKNTFGTV